MCCKQRKNRSHYIDLFPKALETTEAESLYYLSVSGREPDLKALLPLFFFSSLTLSAFESSSLLLIGQRKDAIQYWAKVFVSFFERYICIKVGEIGSRAVSEI